MIDEDIEEPPREPEDQSGESGNPWVRVQTSVQGRPSHEEEGGEHAIPLLEDEVDALEDSESAGGLGGERTAPFLAIEENLAPEQTDVAPGAGRLEVDTGEIDAPATDEFLVDLAGTTSSISEASEQGLSRDDPGSHSDPTGVPTLERLLENVDMSSEAVSSEEPDERGNVFDFGSLPAMMVDWLRELESKTGSYIARLEAWRGAVDVTVFVRDGQIAFGLELNGRLYIDSRLPRHSRELFDDLAQVFEARRRTEAPRRFLISADDLELDAERHAWLARQIARALSRVAQLSRRQTVSFEYEPYDFEEDFEPLTFSPLEIALAHHRESSWEPAEDDPVWELHCSLRDRAEQSWCFRTEVDEPLDALVDFTASSDTTLEQCEAAHRLAEALACDALPFVDEEQLEGAPRMSIGLRGDDCWMVVVDEHYLALHRHHAHLMGTLISQFRARSRGR